MRKLKLLPRDQRPVVGDRVTCHYPTKAYNEDVSFAPGMVGIVVAVAPKVRMVGGDAYDHLPDFLVVDFEWDGLEYRTSLNFINAIKIKPPTPPKKRKKIGYGKRAIAKAWAKS